MMRSIAAVVAGYLVMAVVVMLGTVALVATMVPGGLAAMRQRAITRDAPVPSPSRSYLAGNLVLSLLAAIVGGLVTIRIAPSAPRNHLIALGAMIVAMSVVSARRSAGQQPGWYKVVIPLVGLLGIAASQMIASSRG